MFSGRDMKVFLVRGSSLNLLASFIFTVIKSNFAIEHVLDKQRVKSGVRGAPLAHQGRARTIQAHS